MIKYFCDMCGKQFVWGMDEVTSVTIGDRKWEHVCQCCKNTLLYMFDKC